ARRPARGGGGGDGAAGGPGPRHPPRRPLLRQGRWGLRTPTRPPPAPAAGFGLIMTAPQPRRPRATRMAAPASAPPARLAERYAREFAGSKARYDRARGLFPTGVTHDLRYLEPFPVYIDPARGSRTWAVDGHELLAYWS